MTHAASVMIKAQDFKELLAFRICSDNPFPEIDLHVVDGLLDEISVALGYEDWVDAYHLLGVFK